MAKQVGPLFVTGTVDGIIFYKLGDNYYMRSKGDYKSGKQMRKDPHYKRTMQQADRFGAASKMVKPIYYRYLPKAVRKHGLFGRLTGMVNRWLQQGKRKEEVQEALMAYCQTLVSATTVTVTPAPVAVPVVAAKQTPINQSVKAKPVIAKPLYTTAHRVKQARYLSSWKVKRNGRLHIPRHHTEARLPTVTPVSCQPGFQNPMMQLE